MNIMNLQIGDKVPSENTEQYIHECKKIYNGNSRWASFLGKTSVQIKVEIQYKICQQEVRNVSKSPTPFPLKTGP